MRFREFASSGAYRGEASLDFLMLIAATAISVVSVIFLLGAVFL